MTVVVAHAVFAPQPPHSPLFPLSSSLRSDEERWSHDPGPSKSSNATRRLADEERLTRKEEQYKVRVKIFVGIEVAIDRHVETCQDLHSCSRRFPIFGGYSSSSPKRSERLVSEQTTLRKAIVLCELGLMETCDSLALVWKAIEFCKTAIQRVLVLANLLSPVAIILHPQHSFVLESSISPHTPFSPLLFPPLFTEQMVVGGKFFWRDGLAPFFVCIHLYSSLTPRSTVHRRPSSQPSLKRPPLLLSSAEKCSTPSAILLPFSLEILYTTASHDKCCTAIATMEKSGATLDNIPAIKVIAVPHCFLCYRSDSGLCVKYFCEFVFVI
ncbi:hypothetical protein KSP40_PGU002584 [Platanthera guangdongensis]|uniref:Uncharacterized protein n=1 Tax=Platanthera guangdongensis TaxID=2320717 RepID=A0ABR2MIK7_9ASPA